jgi:hypothetical protein
VPAFAWLQQQLIGNLPSSYEARPGSAQPGLDGEAWAKVQKVIDRERSTVADQVDKVAHDIAAAKQAQAELTARVAALASEGLEVKALSEALKGKLAVLELERQAAYTAAQVCDAKVGQCASPHDVERLCSKDNVEAASLQAMLSASDGPLRKAVASLVAEAQAKDHGCTTKAYVDRKWAAEMRRVAADGVGMRDYALGDGGGRVVPHFTSPAYTPKGALLSTDAKQRYLGLGRGVGGASDALSLARGKGDCFAFNGAAGVLTVKLSAPVVVTAITVEHLAAVFSESGGDSAPKDFKVFAYPDAASLEAAVAAGGGEGSQSAEAPLLVGTYDLSRADPVQVFELAAPSDGAMQFVRLVVASNHGNGEYTCLYRLRVHGHELDEAE